MNNDGVSTYVTLASSECSLGDIVELDHRGNLDHRHSFFNPPPLPCRKRALNFRRNKFKKPKRVHRRGEHLERGGQCEASARELRLGGYEVDFDADVDDEAFSDALEEEPVVRISVPHETREINEFLTDMMSKEDMTNE